VERKHQVQVGQVAQVVVVLEQYQHQETPETLIQAVEVERVVREVAATDPVAQAALAS
jgi:hypothetical protein